MNLTDLTDEALNIAMCEARGWKPRISVKPEYNLWLEPNGISEVPVGMLPSHVNPDDLTSLGNMHLAEEELLSQSKINDARTSFHLYFRELHALCVGSDEFDKSMKPENWAITATARQRAIAWLTVKAPR